MTLIAEILISKVFDEAYDKLKDLSKNKDIQLIVQKENIISAMEYHLKYLVTKTASINFKDISSPKDLSKQHVDLIIFKDSRRQFPLEFDRIKVSLEDMVNTSGHSFLLGDPGGGKSTTLKFIAQKALKGNYPNYNFPVLIHLNDLEDDETLFNRLRSIFGLEVILTSKHPNFHNENFPSQFPEGAPHIKQLYYRLINTYIESLGCLILIDGVDELSENKFQSVIDEIRILSENLQNTKFIATCRTGAFNFYVENSSTFEIQPLLSDQIVEFAINWFVDKEAVIKFMQQMNTESYLESASRPLALAQLCTLYDKYKCLPDKPKLVFSRLLKLYIENWDLDKGLKRSSSDYAKLETERKIDFLKNFAYQLIYLSDKKVYAHKDFTKAYEKICGKFNIPIKDVEKGVSDIESHDGIIIQSSADSFQFLNKSTQEYLTASYILGMPSIPYNLISVKRLHNELAIAVSLSTTPNEYFISAIFDFYCNEKQNLYEFISRIAIEKPDFQMSTFLAYSFYYCFSQISDVREINALLKKLNTNPTIRGSFALYNSFCIQNDTNGKIQISLDNVFEMDVLDNNEYWMEYAIKKIPFTILVSPEIMKNIS